MMRAIAAVAGGFVTWVLVATICNLGLRAALPGYAAAEPDMAFTLPMLVGRLLVALVASLAAGLVAGVVGRAGGRAGGVLAILLLMVFLPVHYRLWARFPAWYHLFFLATLVPAVLGGVALATRRARGAVAA